MYSNLLEGLPHLVLRGLDRVHLAHERVLGLVVDQVDALPALPVVDALGCDAHRALGLGEGALQVLPRLHEVVGLVEVLLQLGVELGAPEAHVVEALADAPVRVPGRKKMNREEGLV